jgi:hypothetical protein
LKARSLSVGAASALTAIIVISAIERHHGRADPARETTIYLRDEWHVRAAACTDAHLHVRGISIIRCSLRAVPHDLRTTLAGNYGGPPDRKRLPPYSLCLSVDHHNDDLVGLISYGYPSLRGFSRDKPCGTTNDYSGY